MDTNNECLEPDFNILRQYFDVGCFLYAQRWSEEKGYFWFVDWTRRRLPPTRGKRAMIHGKLELAGALENGVRAFSFCPHGAGLVCFAVSEEGREKWSSFYDNDYFSSVAHTVVCEAPDGTEHYYFKDEGDCYLAGELAPGIAVYGTSPFDDMLIAGGSATSGQYRLSDKLCEAPSIPNVLYWEAKRRRLVFDPKEEI